MPKKVSVSDVLCVAVTHNDGLEDVLKDYPEYVLYDSNHHDLALAKVSDVSRSTPCVWTYRLVKV